jgi:hypothetical protein
MPAASASYAGEYALSASDLEVVARVQAEGIGYVRGMLTGDELAAARCDFTAAFTAAYAGAINRP